MLTDSNNIYKMCPIYNQIISREAQIGDYILTYNSVGVVIDEYYALDIDTQQDVDELNKRLAFLI